LFIIYYHYLLFIIYFKSQYLKSQITNKLQLLLFLKGEFLQEKNKYFTIIRVSRELFCKSRKGEKQNKNFNFLYKFSKWVGPTHHSIFVRSKICFSFSLYLHCLLLLIKWLLNWEVVYNYIFSWRILHYHSYSQF